jgi:hypothetical protein
VRSDYFQGEFDQKFEISIIIKITEKGCMCWEQHQARTFSSEATTALMTTRPLASTKTAKNENHQMTPNQNRKSF